MSKENFHEIELENRSVINAVASILSISPTEVHKLIPTDSESFKEFKCTLNNLLNDGLSDKWRRTLSFELKAEHLDKASLKNASSQFDNSLNRNNLSDIARKNYGQRLSILKNFQEKISSPDDILLVEETFSEHTMENGIYRLTLQIESCFHQLYHKYEQVEMDMLEEKNPDLKNLILDLNQIKQVVDRSYTALTNYIEGSKVFYKGDSIWEKLIINSSINRTIVEFDEFYRLSCEVNNLIEDMFDDINFDLDFSLPSDIFVDEIFKNLSIVENFSKEKIKNQVNDFLLIYFNLQNSTKISSDFHKIHGSNENRNLVNLIFIWLANSGVTLNSRVFGDTNPNKKIVTSRQKSLKEARSTSGYYIIRRLYDTLFYSTQLKQELFNKNNIFEYQKVIAYKRSKIREIFVSLKFLNIDTLNRLSTSFSE